MSNEELKESTILVDSFLLLLYNNYIVEIIMFNDNLYKLRQIFLDNKYELYLVGGSVRDILIGKKPHDYDFTTNATPDQMIEIANKSNVNIIPTGIRYGTVTFRIGDESFEVTTYRKDSNYSDGRRPDQVTFSTNILDDLSRRDFTINAIALNMIYITADYIDPFNGIEDIKNKLIRTVGDPMERFTEDGLRILRAIRLKFKLGFDFDNNTYNAIINNWNLLAHVSQERITAEFLQILEYGKLTSSEDCHLMDGLIEYILPKECYVTDIYDCKWWYYNTLFEFKDIETKLAYLLKDSYENVLDICSELKLSNKMSKDILESIYCKNAFEELHSGDGYVYIIRKLVSKCGKDNALRGLYLYDEVYQLTGNEWLCFTKAIKDTDEECTHIADLELNGNDLIKLGYKGKQIGEALKYLLDNVLHNQYLNTKEKLIKLLDGFKC